MDIEKDEQDQLAKKKKRREFVSNTKPRNLNTKTEKGECSK